MSEFVYIIIFIILAIILSSPIVKGKIGEGSVKLFLSRLDKENYIVLNDLLIPNEKGRKTQIDHLVLSVYGIFVIETKNYKGWITGHENGQYWTQTIYRHKEKMYNPIRQNRGHIDALKNVLKDFPHVPYYSIIAFSTRAELKIGPISSARVVYTPQILKIIKEHDRVVISKKELYEIYKTIKSASTQDKEDKKSHVKTIRKDLAEKNNKIKENICPSCGGTLVLRSGKYGKFKGCSNYPKCRFTYKIS